GVEAIHKCWLHQNRDTEGRKLRLQRADGGGQQQAIPHGTKANEKNTGCRRKAMKQVFSQHRAHRPDRFGTPLRGLITTGRSPHAFFSVGPTVRFASLPRLAALLLPAGPPPLSFAPAPPLLYLRALHDLLCPPPHTLSFVTRPT